MKSDSVTFKKINKRLCPSGMWDNGIYDKSGDTVEIPRSVLKEAVVVRFPKGVKGISELVSRIDLRGVSYLVVGGP